MFRVSSDAAKAASTGRIVESPIPASKQYDAELRDDDDRGAGAELQLFLNGELLSGRRFASRARRTRRVRQAHCNDSIVTANGSSIG